MSGLDFIDYTFQMHSKGGHIVNFQPARWTTTAAGNKYYNAFLAEDGSYVIMERDFTNLTIKYYHTKASEISAGTRTLDIDWGLRTTRTYVEYDALFS